MATKRLILCCVVMMALTGAGTALWGQSGGFAYVANSGSNNVSAYSIDGTTGALTPVADSPFPAGRTPVSVTVDPTGQFAYTANLNSSNVSAYTIDGTTGALTPVAGSPFPAGTEPRSVTVDPTGQFAYVTNRNSGDVSAYTIDGTTGALTEVVGSPFLAGTRPWSVAVDPTGQFDYVANDGENDVSAYRIDGTTGALTPVAGSPFPAGTDPQSVTVDPTGQFAYVANFGDEFSGNVSGYAIDATTGALTPVAASPFPAGSDPFSVTVDPTGQFVYVANSGYGFDSGNVSAYTIDRITGALTEVAGSPFPAGFNPISVTVELTGRFACVANYNMDFPGNVSAYSIDGTTGALTEIGGSPFPTGSLPFSVTTTAGPSPPAF